MELAHTTLQTQHDMEHSLIYAQTIQNGLLPKQRHFDKFFKDYFVIYKPQNKIGGDFYWLTQKDDTIFFAVADCTGHGVSGAMLSVLGISLLNYVIQKPLNSVGEFLTELDKKWIETFNNELHDSHFNNDWMEMTIVSYDTKNKKLQYAAAGGEFAIQQNKEIKCYKGNNFPIGGWQIEKNRTFDTYDIELNDAFKIYLFSDGLKHQFDALNNKKFSKKQLLNVLDNHSSFPMNNQKEILEFIFHEWKQHTKQTDDITLVGIEFE